VEAPVRAKILSTVFEAILTMPISYPRYFFTADPIPLTNVKICAHPRDTPHQDTTDTFETLVEDGEAEIIDVIDGLACKLLVVGIVPEKYIKKLGILSAVTARYEIKFDGNLGSNGEFDDLSISETAEDVPPPDFHGVPSSHPIKYSFSSKLISSDGSFRIEMDCIPPEREGFYKVEITVSVEDVDGREWSLVFPKDNNSHVIYLCVGHVKAGNENDSQWSQEPS